MIDERSWPRQVNDWMLISGRMEPMDDLTYEPQKGMFTVRQQATGGYLRYTDEWLRTMMGKPAREMKRPNTEAVIRVLVRQARGVLA